MTNSAEPIQVAIQLARSGERSRARAAFLEIVRQEPGSFRAWLWLSELADTRAEQIAALEQALAHCSEGPEICRRLQARLDDLRGAPSPVAPFLESPTPETVEQLQERLKANPQNTGDWMRLSELQQDTEEKFFSLQKVHALDPNNEEASRRIEALRPNLPDPLHTGRLLEEDGKFDEALLLYRTIVLLSRKPTERLVANRRIDSIRLHQEANQVQPVSPTLNLLRVMFGPVLLFALMVFIQSGLNPLRTPLLAIPGIICVMAGSLLVSVTGMRPMHPQWIALCGTPGTGDEPQKREEMRWLGWLLMLAPFTIFLIEAGFRLGVLQSAMMGKVP